MINRIISVALLFFLLIALSIKLVDSTITYVSVGGPFLAYMRSCSVELNSFKIAIPDIPHIPIEEIVEDNTGDNIFDFFKNFARGFFTFINFIVDILNILSKVINVVLSLIQFIVIMLKNISTLINDLKGNSTSEPVIDYLSSSSGI